MREALAALRDSQQPDAAALFLLACHEIRRDMEGSEEDRDNAARLVVPCLEDESSDDLTAVSEYYGQYQRKLVHLCMDKLPSFD